MVVEQPHFVACGTADFADGKLSFHETIEAAAAFHAPDFILLSSVLQYLERPIDILPSLAATGAPTLLVDRAPILPDVRTRIVVQHVPPSIYSASYPCRLYNEAEFISLFAPQYALADQFDANIGSTIAVEGATGRYRGYLFENTAPARPGIRSPT
jgi:putative methyltransferase (TIGR04325 family)